MANPYLMLAAQVFAGLHGLRARLPAPPGTETPYDPAHAPLPASLAAALQALADDAVLMQGLGAPMAQVYLAVRRQELARHAAADDKAAVGTPRILRPILRTNKPAPMSHITLHLQDKDGSQHTVKARIGRSLMQAAVDAGLDGIAADCGGSLSCATCHIIIAAEPGWPCCQRLMRDEAAMLEMTAAPAEPGSRLACQLKLAPALDGLQARLPATQY